MCADLAVAAAAWCCQAHNTFPEKHVLQLWVTRAWVNQLLRGGINEVRDVSEYVLGRVRHVLQLCDASSTLFNAANVFGFDSE